MNPARLARTAVTLAALAASSHASAQRINMDAWRVSNEHRALMLQSQLHQNMPLVQTTLLATHNSFNASPYESSPGLAAYTAFQHSYTMSEQLDLGVRILNIDVHWLFNQIWGAHGQCDHSGVVITENLPLFHMVSEIRDWLLAHPTEVVFIRLQTDLHPSNCTAITPSEYAARQAMYLQIIELAMAGAAEDLIIRDSEIPLEVYDDLTLATLRQHGQALFMNFGGCCDGSDFYNDVLRPDFTEFTGNCVSWASTSAKDFESGAANWRYWQGNCAGIDQSCPGSGPAKWHWVSSTSSCTYYDNTRSLTPWGVQEAVRAGVDIVELDPIGRSITACGFGIIDRPADQMATAAIWSWSPSNLPPPGVPGAAVASMASPDGMGRFHFAPFSDVRRYAMQDRWGNWRLSEDAGPFTTTPALPAGMNFRVPGNGFEMQTLSGAMMRAGVEEVWVNYHDTNADGAWTASTQPRVFHWSQAADPVLAPNPVHVAHSLALIAAINALPDVPAGQDSAIRLQSGSYPGQFTVQSDHPVYLIPCCFDGEIRIGQ